MDTPWTKSPREILEHFRVHSEQGLTAEQAANHAKLYGKNGLWHFPPPSTGK